MTCRSAFLVLTAALAVAAGPRADACTTFCARSGDAVLFARNYDFEIGDGVLLVNGRGLRKQGFLERGPGWTAAYGSVTFNQFGRDFPMGGMNEKGLVVELMWLDQTRYPEPDRRSELGVLEWIQYQLDTAATVEQVLASDEVVRIAGTAPLHYLVSDATGAVATVEFLDGRLVSHRGTALPVAVLTNSTYEDSLRFWRRHGESSLPRGSASEARFARAATQVKQLARLSGPAAVEAAFAILANVAQSSTRWSVVYDQSAREVYFRTDHRPAIRSLRLDGQDFSCRLPARFLDLDTEAAGDVAPRLRPYTTDVNRTLVEKDYAASSVTRRTPPAEVAAIAAHPETATCTLPTSHW